MKKTILCKYSHVDIITGFIETTQSLFRINNSDCVRTSYDKQIYHFSAEVRLRVQCCDKYLMMFTDHKHWKIFFTISTDHKDYCILFQYFNLATMGCFMLKL